MASNTDLSRGDVRANRRIEQDDHALAVVGLPVSALPPDPAAYRPSHRQLLCSIHAVPTASSTRVTLDAVVVPTARSFHSDLPGLRLAARLAAAQDSSLIVLCSRAAQNEEFPEAIRRDLGDKLVVWDVPEREACGLPDLWSSRNPLSTLWRANDVGTKRNLGLTAAVQAGWNYVLFVDDDISTYEHAPTLDEDGLVTALGAMSADADLRAVGWTVDDFPDNSVVGHARRLADIEQQVFIGSGALLVRCDTSVPFFPGVYNEDWLFLIAIAQASLDHRKCLAVAGSVRQRPYFPYSAARTRSQEAGDLLGEGLMNLLEEDGPGLWAMATTIRYWRKAVTRRAGLIQGIVRALSSDRREPKLGARAAMETALDAQRCVKPEALRDYVADWKADLQVWRRYLETVALSRPSVIEPLAGVRPRHPVVIPRPRGERSPASPHERAGQRGAWIE